MARITINGIRISYELIGSGRKAISVTPGGSFSMDTP